MIFIDTGPFIARYLKSDQYHRLAVEGWRKLKGQHCLTTSHVVDEVITLLFRRTDIDFALSRGHQIFASEQLNVLQCQREDELAALSEARRLRDQKISYTDCLSFAAMKRLGISTAFSFDKHFEFAGFKLYR